MRGRRIEMATAATLAATALCSAAVAVAGFTLLDRYRPAFAEPWTQQGPVRSSAGWVRWQDRLTVAAAVLAVVTLVVGTVAARLAADRRGRRRSALAMGASVVAGSCAAVVLATRSSAPRSWRASPPSSRSWR